MATAAYWDWSVVLVDVQFGLTGWWVVLLD